MQLQQHSGAQAWRASCKHAPSITSRMHRCMRTTTAPRAAAAGAPPDMAAAYEEGAELPESYLGPVAAVRVPGMGRGLEATRSVTVGELLMVCGPLALVVREDYYGGADTGAEDQETQLSGEASDDWRTDKGAGAGSSGAGSQGRQQQQQEEDEEAEAEGGAEEDDEVEEPDDDEIEGLQVQLLRALDAPRVQAWLDLLDNGTPQRQAQLPDLHHLASLPGPSPLTWPGGAAAAISSAPAATSTGASGAAAAAAASEQVADLVDLHYQMLEEDPLLARLRMQGRQKVVAGRAAASGSAAEAAAAAAAAAAPASRTAIGVWPEASLLNHSCAPNVSVLAVDGRLLVTAARPLAKHGQLLTSYLTPERLLTPLETRRRALQSEYGFQCRCSRCTQESRLDKQLLQLASDVHEAATQQLGPDLVQAWRSGSSKRLESLRDQAAAYVEVLDAAFSKLGLKPQSQIWVQAGVFKVYELTALALELLGESDPRLLELLAALAGAVAPGSHVHAYWARQYRQEAEAEAEEDPVDGRGALQHADGLVFAAHVARYGAKGCSRSVHRRLLALAQELEVAE